MAYPQDQDSLNLTTPHAKPKISAIQGSNLATANPKFVCVAYETKRGSMLCGASETVLASKPMREYDGKVQLIFTSPPFPLNRKKKYGNHQGDDYIKWLASFAHIFKKLLKKDGSIVMEMGNAWEPGKPVMSTLALRALLAFLDAGGFHLCQQFIVHNPTRLPSLA